MGVLLGTVVVLPFFLQDSLGASALQTGLLVLPGGLLEGLVHGAPLLSWGWGWLIPTLLAPRRCVEELAKKSCPCG